MDALAFISKKLGLKVGSSEILEILRHQSLSLAWASKNWAPSTSRGERGGKREREREEGARESLMICKFCENFVAKSELRNNDSKSNFGSNWSTSLILERASVEVFRPKLLRGR